MRLPFALFAAALSSALSLSSAGAAEEQNFVLTIKDHRFQPEVISVAAGQPFSLTIVNDDPTAEEFESNDLHVEKIVGGNSRITVRVGALKKGTYKFVGERHEDTALGKLLAE